MGGSAAISLSLLSLGPERKVKCYNGYFVNGHVFHTEEYGHGRKTYNIGVCIKGSTFSEFEVDYYGRLEKVIELQYHSEQNRVFLFKCYWYDTTNRGITVDPHYGLVEINSKARHRNVNDVFVFAKQCQQVYYTHPFLQKGPSKSDWLSVLKTKPRGRVEVVQDENEDTSVIYEVFQASKLVEPYRVAPSIDLEENLNFRVCDDSLFDVDVEELNDVLSSTSVIDNVDEEDDNHIEEYNEADDNNSIKDEDENSD